MSRPTVRAIARARLLLNEQHSDAFKHDDRRLEICIDLCLTLAPHDPYIATELAAYECSHPELVAALRLRRMGKTAGGSV